MNDSGRRQLGAAAGRELAGVQRQVAVATVTRDDEEAERWLWTTTALKRPKGWRKGAGHRTSWLDARGAADDYWNRCSKRQRSGPTSSALPRQASRQRGARRKSAPRRRRRLGRAPLLSGVDGGRGRT